MHNALVHHPIVLRTSSSPTMAASLCFPSVSLQKHTFFNNASAAPRRHRSGVFMSLSVGKQDQHTLVNDASFADYKPTSAFLFPGQVLQSFVIYFVDNFGIYLAFIRFLLRSDLYVFFFCVRNFDCGEWLLSEWDYRRKVEAC